MCFIVLNELRQEGEKEQRQLRVEAIDQDDGDCHFQGGARADFSFDLEHATLFLNACQAR